MDNLLSHHDVPGCIGGRQGLARRVSDLGVLAIAAVRLLSSDLGISVSHAVVLVREGASGSGLGVLRTAGGVRVELPSRFAAEIQERLADALQAAPRPPRGRPLRDG